MKTNEQQLKQEKKIVHKVLLELKRRGVLIDVSCEIGKSHFIAEQSYEQNSH